MGFRYRKSIKICKGVRVNVSKRGTSLSIGGHGVTTNISRRGVRNTYSIPGTGISFSSGTTKRRKSSSSRKRSTPSFNYQLTPSKSAASPVSLECKITMDDEGQVHFLKPDGSEYCESDIKIIKANCSPSWTEAKRRLLEDHIEKLQERADEFNDDQKQIFEMHRLAPTVGTKADFELYLDELEPDRYEPQIFTEKKPTLNDFEAEAERLAKEAIKGLFKSSERKRYAQEQVQSLYNKAIADYGARKVAFESEERKKKLEFDREAMFDFEETQLMLRALLKGDQSATEEQIENWLADLELPVDINAAFEVEGDTACIDLDLPEIEDFPNQEAIVLASGKYRIKERTKAALKEDYATCVIGLTLFMAANVFCLTPSIQKVLVSGYTQRRNSKGEIADDYVLSAVYQRSKMIGVDLSEVDLEQFLGNFQHRYKPSSTKQLGKIVPFEYADIEES